MRAYNAKLSLKKSEYLINTNLDKFWKIFLDVTKSFEKVE